MKSSVSESIKNGYFNLERLSRSFRLAWPGISPLERLWNYFDSDAELCMSRSQCINYNVFSEQFRFSVVLQAVLVQTELSSTN